ncbi:GAD-like domain-containing protein [Pseudomonas alliivorans]|nr:GAD-like domain-containing protein [Pseudomonas alliivorans]MEE4723198.1 GAD-like domain-containing protein [Pseudomonas alliivorans]MEE4759256.1 GAD-like domain-containing protein [Pseudomonas alliivorans]MEE4763802.1 GAD-like domain-containing protein [Pseudomonas alliivorans]MEE4774727.1 GAD-like domain-containing protein [Pseudomonas alliivorans]
MDEDYAFFLKKFGPATASRIVPSSSMKRYEGKLPAQLLQYWDDYGWCGHANGLFWTVNPQDYEPILKQWLAGTKLSEHDIYHVIARSAFGQLYLWGEKTANSLSITSYMSRYSYIPSALNAENVDFGVRLFFSTMQPERNDLDHLFESALKKLGSLEADEMYGFVPALALGGPMELKNLQKVKVIEHLEFLSQLSPLQDWGFPDL